MLYALTGEYIFGEAGTMCGKLRWEMSVLGFLKILELEFFCQKTNFPFYLILIKIIIQHGKGSKNSSTYFDNRIEIEQESDILIADYSFDECSFFKDDDDDMCA